MKMNIRALAALCLTSLWCGCWQKSIYPFYREMDLAFEPALLGTWSDQDQTSKEGSTTWTFSRGEGDSLYRVAVHDSDCDLDFDGRFFKLDNSRYLDLHSRKRSISEMPTHNLLRVRKTDPALELQVLSPGWVKERLQAHPKEIAHINVIDPDHPNDSEKMETVLTANTDLLQKFLRDHLEAPGFFEDSFELKRKQDK